MSKATKNTSFQYFQDPGHGWVRVPVSLLEELGLIEKITTYSFVKGDYAYLEEDQDASTWVAAMKAANKDFTLVEKHTNNSSTIRNYPSFSKANIDLFKAIQVGAHFYGYNTTTKKQDLRLTIIGITGSKVTCQNDIGMTFKPLSIASFAARVALQPD